MIADSDKVDSSSGVTSLSGGGEASSGSVTGFVSSRGAPIARQLAPHVRRAWGQFLVAIGAKGPAAVAAGK